MAERSDRMPSPDREPLPFERPEEGLYLHDRDGLLELTGLAGIEGDFLPVQRFMEMQRERDEMRKTLALINAALQRRQPLPKVRLLVRNAGLTAADGEAMCSVVDWAQSLSSAEQGGDK